MSHSTTITCKNCGNHFQGKYCNACGEKVYSAKDKSIGSIFEEVVHFITHFDGALFVTLKTFITRPGKMSADYAGGIRKKYFKPVSFFLLLVVAYFLFPRFAGLNMHFSTYISPAYAYAGIAKPIAKKKAEKNNISYEELAERYNHKSPAIAKVCLVLLIPLGTLVLMVLFYTSRRYVFDHFILSSELMSFYIFSEYLCLPAIALLAQKLFPKSIYLFDGDSIYILLPYLIIFAGFIAVAFRNFYRQALWLSILKSLLFLFVFAVGIRYVYSLILYFLVMLFI